MLDIYLVRHAESEMNLHPDIVSGRLVTTPLSETGIRQAALLGKSFRDAGIVFDEIYASTALRAIQTAKATAAYMGFPAENIVAIPDLLEMDLGDWEGKPKNQVYTAPILAALNANNWDYRPANGESQHDVEGRVLGWVERTLIPKYQKDIKIGVFTHAMSIKCLLRGILESSPAMTHKISLENTSITRLRYENDGWHLITLNDYSHLRCDFPG